MSEAAGERTVSFAAGSVELEGTLVAWDDAHGLVLFAHGSGSSRHSPRNRYVAGVLNERGLATLLVDLLTADEDEVDRRTAEFRFDIPLLASRLVAATDWVVEGRETSRLGIGYFGASTGAGAALIAAAERPDAARAIVSRGGRPDLAGDALGRVRAPTLLVVGERDPVVVDLNRQAMEQMTAPVELTVVPHATHLFEEPGALEEVARLAADWFERHVS